MIKWIDSLLDRIFAAVGGLVLSQAPQFMLQYTQRLAGHVDELQIQIKMLRESAALTGKTLEQYVQKFLSSQDPDFMHQGLIIKKILLRSDQLSSGLQAMQESSSFTRPWAFVNHFQYDIAEAAFRSFQPGISFNLETVSYVFIGVLLGFMVYHCVRWLILKLNPMKAKIT